MTTTFQYYQYNTKSERKTAFNFDMKVANMYVRPQNECDKIKLSCLWVVTKARVLLHSNNSANYLKSTACHNK